MVNNPKSVAILQIIPNHHNLLPVKLIQALAALDEAGYPYNFYDIERCHERDFRVALIKLFSRIKEETVLVSMACNNNYPKIESLIFLYLYLPLLKGKKVIICSPYFSLYETSLIQKDNIVFSSLDIDEYIEQNLGAPLLSEDVFFDRLADFLVLYGYQDYRFWSYLTFGCYAQCSFCYNRLPFKGAPMITRHSPETVLKWMEAGKRLGKTYVEFSEPNFLADRPFVKEFLERLQRKNPGVQWRCKTRLDDVDPDIYAQMISAGCRTIFFGVEHVDSTLLQNIHKGEDSFKKLKEFLDYCREDTLVHLSFMTGIRGETPEMLRRNLDVLTDVGRIQNVEPNLGWNTLFNKSNRGEIFPNFAMVFMYITNMIPHRWNVSPALMRDILRVCIKEPFFDFFYLTDCERSLPLMQHLIIYIKTKSQKHLVENYHRFLNYGGGVLTKLILKSRTLEEMNRGVLSLTGL